MRPYAEVDTAWLVACIALSALGVIAAFLTYRRRGASSGIRVLGWGLLPIAIWLTGLSRLLWTVVLEATRWVAGLVVSPRVWAGVALFFVAFVMLGGAGFVRRRRRARAERKAAGAADAPAKGAESRPARGQSSKGQVEKKKPDQNDPLEGMEDIEAILKRRGIE